MIAFTARYARKYRHLPEKQIKLWNFIDRQREPEILWRAQTVALGLDPDLIGPNDLLGLLHYEGRRRCNAA